MNGKVTIQKIGVGVMLFALFGFALIRFFRIDLSPRKKVVITYDSNLEDKIAKSQREEPDGSPGYSDISSDLRTARDDLDRGDVNRSLDELRRAESDGEGALTDHDLADGLKSVEKAVKDGNPEKARVILDNMLKEMSSRSPGH